MSIPFPVPTGSKAYEKALDVFGKILSVAPKGISRIYKDWVKPSADARKIKLMEKAKAEAELIRAEAKIELNERAKARLHEKENQQQENLEEIVFISAEKLSGKVSDSEVDEDWISRFSDIAQNISRTELKTLWAQILAGEIKEPGTFSLRTLELIKNITSEEAKIFLNACKLADSEGRILLGPEGISHPKFGLQYFHVLMLQEAGLILSGGQGGTIALNVKLEKEKPYQIIYDKKIIELRAKESFEYPFYFYSLSRTGIEISTLI